jgi:hypothetical protein
MTPPTFAVQLAKKEFVIEIEVAFWTTSTVPFSSSVSRTCRNAPFALELMLAATMPSSMIFDYMLLMKEPALGMSPI